MKQNSTLILESEDEEPLNAEIFAALPKNYRAVLVKRIAEFNRQSAPKFSNSSRIARRNQLIRDCLADYYSNMRPTRAYQALAADLKRFAQGTFTPDRPPGQGASAQRIALWRILQASGEPARALRPSQIRTIAL